jgi:hypothetical protein
MSNLTSTRIYPTNENIEETLQGIKVGDIIKSGYKYCLVQGISSVLESISIVNQEKECMVYLDVLWLTPETAKFSSTIEISKRTRPRWTIKA